MVMAMRSVLAVLRKGCELGVSELPSLPLPLSSSFWLRGLVPSFFFTNQHSPMAGNPGKCPPFHLFVRPITEDS
jgi:hypothetical protein